MVTILHVCILLKCDVIYQHRRNTKNTAFFSNLAEAIEIVDKRKKV